MESPSPLWVTWPSCTGTLTLLIREFFLLLLFPHFNPISQIAAASAKPLLGTTLGISDFNPLCAWKVPKRASIRDGGVLPPRRYTFGTFLWPQINSVIKGGTVHPLTSGFESEKTRLKSISKNPVWTFRRCCFFDLICFLTRSSSELSIHKEDKNGD